MNRALVVVFVVFISLPLAVNLAGVDGADPVSENRDMAPFPTWTGSWASTADYPAALSLWFEDHFGFRSRLIRYYSASRLFVLGVSSSTAVLKGREGWLYYADDSGLEDYVSQEPLMPADVAAWREALVRAHDWLRARQIGYVFTVAPDKPVIYPEHIPASVRAVSSRTRTDQVLEALAETPVASVDLRPALLAAKASERIYFMTDSHWNDRGAFVAYRQIIEAVRRQVPTSPPWNRDDFRSVEVETPGRDLARLLGLARVLREIDLRLVPTHPRRARVVDPPNTTDPMAEVGRLVTEIDDPRLPRAVIFRDSFASRLAPFLSEHFSRAVYLWQNDFDAQAVLDEKPDVVIEEIVGRHLYGFVASPELVPRQ